MSDAIKHITDSSFEADVLQAGKPVLLDFWAEWCGPCKMITPILEEVAKEYGDKIQIAKMNVDENQEIPTKFGIRGIPTLILFKNGEIAAQKVGALAKSQLTAFLDSHL
jgi:thioredoxin 1